jgi:hypothetical protein
MADSPTGNNYSPTCAIRIAWAKSPINLEDKKQYELLMTLSGDGKHYQIALKPAFDMHDKKSWCTRAAFSDDGGLIFLGSAIDCEGPTE